MLWCLLAENIIFPGWGVKTNLLYYCILYLWFYHAIVFVAQFETVSVTYLKESVQQGGAALG